MINNIFILFLLTILTTNVASAQLEKGSKLIGGGFGFNSGSNDYNKSSSFYVQPSIHYFITDKLSFGLGFRYDNSKSKYRGTYLYNEYVSQGIGFSPELRYYKPIRDKLYLIGGFQTNFIRYRSKSRQSALLPFENSEPYTYLSINFGGGIAYFLTSKIQVEAYGSIINLDYRIDPNNYRNFGGNVSLQNLGIHIRYLL
jgi:hypothetical protein